MYAPFQVHGEAVSQLAAEGRGMASLYSQRRDMLDSLCHHSDEIPGQLISAIGADATRGVWYKAPLMEFLCHATGELTTVARNGQETHSLQGNTHTNPKNTTTVKRKTQSAIW